MDYTLFLTRFLHFFYIYNICRIVRVVSKKAVKQIAFLQKGLPENIVVNAVNEIVAEEN